MKTSIHASLLIGCAALFAAMGCADDQLGVDADGHLKSERAGPYETPSAVSADAFQGYVLELLDFSRLIYDTPPSSLPLHGVPHERRPEWSTSKFQIYTAALDGKPDTVSYVIAIEGSDSLGDFLRDAQAVAARIRTTNPLTGEAGGRLASGFAILVRNYLTGRVGGDAWAGLFDDIESRLEAGDRVEIAITGHSLGGAAAYIMSWYLWQYFEQAWRDAPVQIRNVGFNTPKTFSPLLARDFSEAVRSNGRGPFRLQSYTFTRRNDLVTFGGSPLVHHPMWAPNRADGWVNYSLRFFTRRLRKNIGHCSHLELPERVGVGRGGPVEFVLENHDIDLMYEDLADRGSWRTMAECMARPGAASGEPGFKTFWGP